MLCHVSLKRLLFLTSHFCQLLAETLSKTFSVFIVSTLIVIQVQPISLLSKRSPSSSGAHSPCCVPPGCMAAQVFVCITGLAWGLAVLLSAVPHVSGSSPGCHPQPSLQNVPSTLPYTSGTSRYCCCPLLCCSPGSPLWKIFAVPRMFAFPLSAALLYHCFILLEQAEK